MDIRGFAWRRCSGCRSLFVANPPPPEAIASLYRGRSYFVNPSRTAGDGDALGYANYLADRQHIEAKFDRVLARLEHYSKPGELLDAGAGPGLMLAAARRRGWSPIGIEANPWAAAYARERVGVKVSTGAFGTGAMGSLGVATMGSFAAPTMGSLGAANTAPLGAATLEDGRFQAVTLMDFLEHVAEPERAVAEAARLTRAGGLLAVLTPNAASRVGRLLRSRWPEAAKVPGHLVLFSRDGLSRLLERHGYEVLGWHSVGKTSGAGTLLADATPAAPKLARALSPLVERGPLAGRTLTLDPRTKLCLYARLRTSAARRPQAALSRSL